jgi:alpha-beta hydrolase superfamily lysophospholipase
VRVILGVLAALAGLWVVVAALAFLFQRQLIYLPDRSDPGPPPPGVEALTLRTADGLDLVAWWFPAEGPPRATVLVSPGNAGTRALRVPLAAGLAARGLDVLLLEYRGFGGNPGAPHEEGLRRDALAAVAWWAASPDAARPLVLLGESIGTGVAAATAAALADEGTPPAAVVLRSPFPTLADVAAGHYPFLPVRQLLRERYPVVEDLAGVDAPVLVVAGGADTIVPTARSREVAAALDATYVELPGVDHNDRELLDGARYLDAVEGFVRDTVG